MCISGRYTGLTGPCELDINGDRLNFRMCLYAYGDVPSLRWMSIGYHISHENTVILDGFYLD